MKIYGFVSSLFVASVLGSTFVVDARAATIIPGYPDNVEYSFDPREVALLPHYCAYTKVFRNFVPGGNNKVEIDRWSAVMGSAFNAMHHYCWGLMKTNRALLLARDKKTKTFYLSAAIDDFNFVFRYASRDFVLMPEILTRKGQNLILLGRGANGVTELQRAIEIKPDYWQAYAALSEYYEGTGDVAKARELVEKALTFAPDSKVLTRRLADLDSAKGKKKPSQGEASGG
jgi:tetratricopeptide (TPR) repeat protein